MKARTLLKIYVQSSASGNNRIDRGSPRS